MILPFFNYGDVFLFSAAQGIRSLLNKSLNDCVRFVYGLRLGDHVTSLQRNLLGCPMSRYYDFRAVVNVHKLLLYRCPDYLYRKLCVSESRRTVRLVTPQNRTSLYNDSFFVRGVRTYNALPDSVKSASSMAVFRKRCLELFNER